MIAQLLSFRYALNFLIYSVLSFGYNLGIVKYYWAINILQHLAVISVNLLLLPIIGIKAAAIAFIIVELINIMFIIPFVLNKIRNHSS